MVGPSNEECDDGNYVNGDGCSSWCKIETGWYCWNVYTGIMYEVPNFISKCALIPTTPDVVLDTTSQYLRDILVQEFSFNQYTPVGTVAGKFRLIEYGPDETLKGVTFVANGYDTKLEAAFKYEYTKVAQLVSAATTYYTSLVGMTPNINTNNVAVQRNTFGKVFVKSTGIN